MSVLSISDFLKSKDCNVSGVYGHLVSVFKLKNELATTPLIHCAFADNKGVKLSFRFNYDSHEIHDLFMTNKDQKLVSVLSDEDEALIKLVMPVYFDRVLKITNKITKSMKSDWGRDYRKEVLERSGFTTDMSNEADSIERNCRLNIFSHTLATIDKKRAEAFPAR